MKKIYFLAASLLLLLVNACNKDNSETSRDIVPEVKVSGLATSYSVYTHRDFLKLDPVVEDESNYEYYWTIFSASFQPGQGLVKPDTIGHAKKLDYEILLNPGQYILVFNVKDKKTGVTKLINMPVSISTQNLNGWYILKDDGAKTDLDFIYDGGRRDNWIAFYNGKSLNGTAIRAIFSANFKMTPTSTALFSSLTVASTQDVGVFRIDNGSQLYSFDNMFFQKPEVRKPQAVFESNDQLFIGLINDGKPYAMYKGALFTTMPPNNYNLSPSTAAVYNNITWDEVSKSLVFIQPSYFSFPGNNVGKLKNINAKLMWMTGLSYPRSVVYGLFKNPQDTGYLFKLDATYGPLGGTGDLVKGVDTLKPEHKFMQADALGAYYDADFLYYAQGNKIYMMDFATMTESLQITLPASEKVTFMQHIKYPQTGAGVVYTVDKLAIATYAAGKYKVYLHNVTSTGTITAKAQPDFEGTGRVANVIYMQNGTGNRVF